MPSLTVQDLAHQLASQLNSVVQSWEVDQETPPAWSEEPVGFAQLGEDRFQAWIRSRDGRDVHGLSCHADRSVTKDEVRLMQRIVAVLRSDLETVGDVLVAQDLWSALAETQFLRAAARLSPFATTSLLQWIRTFAAATRQTYEGASFTGSVVLAKQLTTVVELAGDRFHPFTQAVPFEQALLREKWLKPFLQDGRFALVTVGHSGAAQGFVDVAEGWNESPELAPVESLEGLYGFLRPGTSILSASTAGDIHFALSSGITFVNSQGKWRYQNWDGLARVLRRRMSQAESQQALRLVAGSSYERRGSLFVFLNDGVDPARLVPDHAGPNRSALALRSSIAGAPLAESNSIRVLRAASGIDGAVVFRSDGSIADVASMISEPSSADLATAGRSQLERFSGARSTAAWNASIYGLAIKVSDDGPVDAYEAGQLVFHSG